MSAAYLRKGKTVRTVKVPGSDGKWYPRTTGTRDPETARKFELMVKSIGPLGARASDILDSVVSRTISLPQLYDLWRESGKDVEVIRQRLADIDLSPLVEEWHAITTKSVSADTADHYRHHVRTLIEEGKPFLRSRFDQPTLQRWLDGLGVSNATKRKAAAGMASFGTWLSQLHLVKPHIVRDVSLPGPGKPRINYLTTEEATQLVEVLRGPYRGYSALLAGSGIEVSVALGLRRGDVDADRRQVRAAGTKTHSRDRIVRVADWAWGYFEGMLKGLLPHAIVFAGIPSRRAARDAHAAAVEELAAKSPAYAGYTMRDHRHTFAVRAIRAGTPAELVARQLGHANAVLVHKVYGRFIPTHAERDHWEKIASAEDAHAKTVRRHGVP